MTLSLGSLKVGESGTIVGFDKTNSTYRHRLITMGLNRGEAISVKRVAPLGDPIEIKVRGYSLSLRKTEADILKVEKR